MLLELGIDADCKANLALLAQLSGDGRKEANKCMWHLLKRRSVLKDPSRYLRQCITGARLWLDRPPITNKGWNDWCLKNKLTHLLKPPEPPPQPHHSSSSSSWGNYVPTEPPRPWMRPGDHLQRTSARHVQFFPDSHTEDVPAEWLANGWIPYSWIERGLRVH